MRVWEEKTVPIHRLLLVLTQAKSSLVIVTASDSCGPSIKFLQQSDFPLVHTAHLWYTLMGAAPYSEKAQKVLGKTSEVNVEASIFLGPRPKSLPACGDPTAQHMTGSRCLPCHGLTSLYRNSVRTSWVGKRAKVKIHSLKHNHRHADLSPLLSFPSPRPPRPPFSFSHNFNQWNHLYIILTKEYRLRRSPPRLKSQLATYKRSVFTSQMLFLH